MHSLNTVTSNIYDARQYLIKDFLGELRVESGGNFLSI